MQFLSPKNDYSQTEAWYSASVSCNKGLTDFKMARV